MEKLTKKQLEIVLIGLKLYKEKAKKMMKQSEELRTAEKEIKNTFLEVEALISKVSEE